jgi:hypothetical protein
LNTIYLIPLASILDVVTPFGGAKRVYEYVLARRPVLPPLYNTIEYVFVSFPSTAISINSPESGLPRGL